MAIGWLSLLKHVPWTDVIASAPAVADGARKLWNGVARKPEADRPEPAPASAASADPISALDQRIAALESAMAELHAQMVASSELINALAAQNKELIARVEANRGRVVVLAIAAAAAIGLAATTLVLLLAR